MNILQLLATDGYITVNKSLIKLLGLNEAILLGDLCSKQLYWADRDGLTEDGYFFCTAEALKEDTTLSPHSQRKALKNLEDAGLISTQIRGIPATKYFKINTAALASLFLDKFDTDNNNENLQHDDDEIDSKQLRALTTNSKASKQLKVKSVNGNNNKEIIINNNNKIYNTVITDIIEYLNSKTNSKYRSNSKTNNKYILARLEEGYSFEDFKKVIDNKLKDQFFIDNNYLRPSTLFGDNFENYLNEKPKFNPMHLNKNGVRIETEFEINPDIVF